MTLDATDDLAGAPDITAGGTVHSGTAAWDNTAATQADGEPQAYRYGPVVWHKAWIPAATTCVFADTYPPDGDTVMELYRGPANAAAADLVSITTGDDEAGNFKAQIVYDSPGGEWLYLAHAGYGNDTVAGQSMTWSTTVPSMWTRSRSTGTWFADLGVVTDLPTGPPPSSLLNAHDDLVRIAWVVHDTTFSGLISDGITDTYWNAYRQVQAGVMVAAGATQDRVTTAGISGATPTGSTWRLAVQSETVQSAATPSAVATTLAPAAPPPIDPPPPPPPRDRPTARLYDTDGAFLTALPLAAGIQFQDESSAPGAVSLRLPLDDPTTAQLTARRIIKIFWRGQFRQAARIDSAGSDVAVDGRMWREWSSIPGLLNILNHVPIYPEYGLARTSNTSRTFGYMARIGHGVWLESGNFTSPIGVPWSQMTGARRGYPTGLDFPDPQWIAKHGPNYNEPVNYYQYFRRTFTTDRRMSVQILATGDNYIDLWLDGNQLVSSDGQSSHTWREAFQITQWLEPSPVGGRHVIAARVRNGRLNATDGNHSGLLFTMQELDDQGNVIEQTPIINSNENYWIVSDIAPGFRRAEVITRVWSESNLYEYAATGLINLGFSITHDTDGNLWEDAPSEYTVDVGSSVLDLLGMFTEKDVDVRINPATLRLDMWNRRGADLTASVQLNRGRDGGNLISHRIERIEPEFNSLLLQLADGRWMQRQNTAAVNADGREATGLAMGSTSDTGSAYHIADAQLLDASRTTITFTTQVSSVTGPQPYVDFNVGDTIAVPNEAGTAYYAARVMAITVDASTDGPVQITPELVLDRSVTPPVFNPDGSSDDDPGDLGGA